MSKMMTATPTPLRAAADALSEAGAVECPHEAWEELSGWCRCVDCGHGWRALIATPPAASGDDVLAMLDHDIGVAKRRGDIAVSVAVEVLEKAANLIRRLAAVAPAGMMLVPREPTPEMIERGVRGAAWMGNPVEASQRECARIYAAMLAAAPTPPATAGQVSNNN